MKLSTYHKHRSTIQTGDLLAVQGQGPFSWVVRKFTGGKYSHVAMFVRLDDIGINRLFIIHSTGSTGVVFLPVSRYLKDFEGKADFVPLKAFAVAGKIEARNNIRKFLMLSCGRGYDFRGVLKFAFPFIKDSKEKDYCSKLAGQALENEGILTETLISPNALVDEFVFGKPIPLNP